MNIENPNIYIFKIANNILQRNRSILYLTIKGKTLVMLIPSVIIYESSLMKGYKLIIISVIGITPLRSLQGYYVGYTLTNSMLFTYM